MIDLAFADHVPNNVAINAHIHVPSTHVLFSVEDVPKLSRLLRKNNLTLANDPYPGSADVVLVSGTKSDIKKFAEKFSHGALSVEPAHSLYA